MTELEKRAKKYARKDVYYGAYVDDEAGEEIAEEAYIEGATEETKLLVEENRKAKEIIRELIESMQPIKFEEDRQRAIAKAEAFLKE